MQRSSRLARPRRSSRCCACRCSSKLAWLSGAYQGAARRGQAGQSWRCGARQRKACLGSSRRGRSTARRGWRCRRGGARHGTAGPSSSGQGKALRVEAGSAGLVLAWQVGAKPGRARLVEAGKARCIRASPGMLCLSESRRVIARRGWLGWSLPVVAALSCSRLGLSRLARRGAATRVEAGSCLSRLARRGSA